MKTKPIPGLAMTRSIGDTIAGGVGVTSEPEVQVFSELKPQDKALVIASDGLFDRLSNQEIADIVMSQPYYDRRDADGVLNILVNESVLRWQREHGMIDDITIVLAYLNIQAGNEE